MKKQRQAISPQKKKPDTPPKNQKSSSFNKGILFGKQVLVALVGLFLLVQVKKSVDSYRWIYDDLLKGNMETIRKYPNLSTDERYILKMGFPISFMNHIKANTPDSAVILFPDSDVFANTKDPKQDLSGMLGWCSSKYAYYRLLYPRKVVFESEKEQSPFFEKITHVAIVNGWGYDYLKTSVPVEFRTNNAILPVQN